MLVAIIFLLGAIIAHYYSILMCMKEVRKKCFASLLLALIPSSAFAYAFSQNLTVGSSGNEVSELQSVLVEEGYLTMPAGIAQGYFGALTQSALKSYQTAKGISPATGYFGPLTRTYINTHFSANATSPSSQEKTSNVISQKQYFGSRLTANSKNAPKITSISKSSAKITDRITVSGDNFGDTVTIYSSVGTLKNKKVKDNSFIFNLTELLGNRSELSGLPITFSVGNSKGISSEYGYIVIE